MMSRSPLALFLALACCGEPSDPEHITATEALTTDDPTTSSTSEGDGGSTTTGPESTGAADSTGEGSAGTESGGYVCEAVGQPCSLVEGCGEGLDCVPLGDLDAGVCGRSCSASVPCEVGECDEDAGLCEDPDGLPIALCVGLGECAGDPCEGECGAGLTCKLGSCIHACDSLTDCPAVIGADACKVNACFAGDELAGAC